MKLLITGALPCAQQIATQLEALGHETVFLQNERDPLPCPEQEIEGVICNGLFLSHPIEQFTRLRYIQLTSAGFDRVPMDYVREHGIKINNARGVYSIPMAEFAVCGVLQLYKQSRFFARNQALHRWEKHRELCELFGKTVCVIGCGSVGTECAKRFAAFGCQVIGADLYPHEDACYQKIVPLGQLDEILPTADVVILTLPLTGESRHLMNENRLSRLKSRAILVNIARGGVVDTDALLSVLPNIGGAVLDVFEEEPLPPDSPLWDMDNVIITPHNSFVGDGNVERIQNNISKWIGEISC